MAPLSSLIFQSLLISLFALKLLFVISQMPQQKNFILGSAIAYLHFYLDFIILIISGILITPNIFFPYYLDPKVFATTFIVFITIVSIYFKFFIYDHIAKSPKIIIFGNPEKIEEKLFKTINNFLFLKGINVKEFPLDEFTYYKLENVQNYKSPFLCVEKKREKNALFCSYELTFEEDPGVITNEDYNHLIKDIYTQVPQIYRFLLIVLFFVISVLVIYWFGIIFNRWHEAIFLYSITQPYILGRLFFHERTIKHKNFELFPIRYQNYKVQKNITL